MHADVVMAEIGSWYQRLDTGDLFQVTGIDDHSETIEIQDFAGTIDEIDVETWISLPLGFADPVGAGDVQTDDMEAADLLCAQAQETLDDPELLARLG
jgi:hypothetical protein